MKKKQQKQQKLQTPTKRNNKHDTTELTFLEHLYELRSRLFWIVATIILASAAGFQFKDQLIAVVMDPLHGQKLVYLTPGGGFGFIFTLAIYFGVLLAVPVIVYHFYRFLQPLLKKASRKLVVTFMLLSCLLAASGAAFGYFVTIPAALDFLATFAGDAVIPSLTAESYLNFVVTYILGLALLFQLPLLLYLSDHVRPFPPGSLLSSQRYVIIGATIVAAVITPTPDAVNMALVAVPIVAIYQLGVVAVSVRHKAVKRSQRKASRAQQMLTEQVSEPMTQIFKEIEGQGASLLVPEKSAAPKTSVVSLVIAEQVSRAKDIPVATSSEVLPKEGKSQTIDGVIRVRQPQPVAVPLRITAKQRLIVASRTRYDRPIRSLDGLSMLRYSTNS